MVPPEYFCRIGILDSNSVLKNRLTTLVVNDMINDKKSCHNDNEICQKNRGGVMEKCHCITL